MRRGAAILALAASGLLVLAGCSTQTRQKVLPMFFDGVPKGEEQPAPPTRRVRRDLLREIEELKRQLAEAQRAAEAGKECVCAPAEATPLPVELARTWEEAARILPRDKEGQVDWGRALAAGTIAPRPAPGRAGPLQAVLDWDVVRVPEAGEMFKVVFPHAAHTGWLACASCHPAPFAARRGATPMSMDRINAGELCGACHGTVAFPVTACGRCHPAMAAEP